MKAVLDKMKITTGSIIGVLLGAAIAAGIILWFFPPADNNVFNTLKPSQPQSMANTLFGRSNPAPSPSSRVSTEYRLPGRPACREWHVVKRGETQWAIARSRAYQYADKKQWIKSMRWMSGKSPADVNLNAGEWLCVGWG